MAIAFIILPRMNLRQCAYIIFSSVDVHLSGLDDNFCPIFFMAFELVHGMSRTARYFHISIGGLHISLVIQPPSSYPGIYYATTEHACKDPAIYARFTQSSCKVVLGTLTCVRVPVETVSLFPRLPCTHFATRDKSLDFRVVYVLAIPLCYRLTVSVNPKLLTVSQVSLTLSFPFFPSFLVRRAICSW